MNMINAFAQRNNTGTHHKRPIRERKRDALLLRINRPNAARKGWQNGKR